MYATFLHEISTTFPVLYNAFINAFVMCEGERYLSTEAKKAFYFDTLAEEVRGISEQVLYNVHKVIPSNEEEGPSIKSVNTVIDKAGKVLAWSLTDIVPSIRLNGWPSVARAWPRREGKTGRYKKIYIV